MYVGTAITESYIKRATPYLKSLTKYRGSCLPFCICIGFQPSVLANTYPDIQFFYLDKAQATATDTDYTCVQYGVFLDAIHLLTESDTIILTDADMVLQRPLNLEELNRFDNYDDNMIGLGWNAGIDDTLRLEAYRLKMNVGIDDIEIQYPDIESRIYNMGFIVGKPLIWRQIRPLYEVYWPIFTKLFNHYAKTQWLMNYLVYRLKLNIDVLGYEIHTHAHYPLGLDHSVTEEDIVLYKDQITYVRHAFLENPDIVKQLRQLHESNSR